MRFSGQVSTVKCFENNPLVRKVSSYVRGLGVQVPFKQTASMF